MEWEKSRLYSSLGQPGFAPTDGELLSVNAAQAWGEMRADVMPFRGQHPPAARRAISELSRAWSATFADVESLFSRINVYERLRRSVREAIFARLVALRGLEARARWGWAAGSSIGFRPFGDT